MATATDTFSVWPRIRARIESWVISQDIGGNSSTYGIQLIVEETEQQDAYATGTYAVTWDLTANGQNWSGEFEYDFRPGGLQQYVLFNGQKTVTHDAAGAREANISASFEESVIGTANPVLNYWLPQINRVPGAPTVVGISEITASTFRYKFQGTSDGGSPILEWQIGWGTDPNAHQLEWPSSGDIVVTNLAPNTKYYIWSRGRNENGWGAWSERSEVTTLQGARVRINGVWVYAVPYVKHNGVWKPAEPFIKASGAWKRST